MTRTMGDAIPGAIAELPPGLALVAGYIDAGPHPADPAHPVMTAADWATWPHAIPVRIATQAGTNDGHVLDVERGDATPDQAPGWCVMRRHAGMIPTVYASTDAWPELERKFAAAGVELPQRWVAQWDGVATLPAGAVAKQYLSVPGYDLSVVADHWPGVDSGGGTVTDIAYVASADNPAAVFVFDKVAVRHVGPTEWAAVQYATGGAPNGRTLDGNAAPAPIILPADWWATLPVLPAGPVGGGSATWPRTVNLTGIVS